MSNVFDVAAYILEKCGTITAWKLQKLVYYSQAWSLVWDEEPLFPEKVEAWANGPVVRELYNAHRGEYKVANIGNGNPGALSEKQRETVDAVIRDYGGYSSQYLSDLTHIETPWREARAGVPDGYASSVEISLESMQRFYEGLSAE